MENILHELYFRRIQGFERSRDTSDISAINEKIVAERKYFEDKMTDEDVKRFQELESLYTKAGESYELDTFIYGFKLGAMFAKEMASTNT